MAPESLVSQALASPEKTAEVLKGAGRLKGISQAYFEHVARLYGANPGAASDAASHWKAFAQNGDRADFAYRAKAIGERIRGEWLQSAKSFAQAAKLAERPADKFLFQTGAVDSLARGGKPDEAVALGKRLHKGLLRLGEDAAAARVALNVGNALLWKDKYAQARAWFEKAQPVLKDAGLSREGAAALLGKAAADLYGGHPDAARKSAQESKLLFDELGDTYHSDLSALTIAHADLLQGRADDALSQLVSLRDRLQDSPADAARIEEFIGDAHLMLNLFDEAEAAFLTALKNPSSTQLALNRANCYFGIGLAQLEKDSPNEALENLKFAGREYLRLGNEVWAGAAYCAMSNACIRQGKASSAKRYVSKALGLLSSSRSPYHFASALLLAAEIDDVRHVRGAKTHVDRNGFKQLAWRLEYVKARAAAPNQKLKHYRRMFAEMLAARAAAKSSISRLSFLRNKTHALAEYIRFLLHSNTRARTREALDVIAKSRSVALIDEIISSRSAAHGELIGELQTLRDEITHELGQQIPGGPSRLIPPSGKAVTDLQRRWLESMHRIQESLLPDVSAATDVAVLVQTHGELHVLIEGDSMQLPISAQELQAKLRWLEFELLGPMVRRDSEPGCALQILAELRDELISPWHNGKSVFLSPEGVLWNVPWQALFNLDGAAEPVLLPSPGFGTGAASVRLPKKPRAALWVSDMDLPYAKAESKAFLSAFPNAAVCTRASEVRSMLHGAEFDLLHVASHAIVRRQNPMFSGIRLDDGVVLAAEIAQSGLRVGIATLSACDTGRISLWSRSEPDGLARAFLARGAAAVAASMWPLDDKASSEMMNVYYRELSAGSNISISLGAARAAMKSIEKHPYFWAPIVLFGGYGENR